MGQVVMTYCYGRDSENLFSGGGAADVSGVKDSVGGE